MHRVEYQHTCSECNKEYKKYFNWIDPSLYTNPKNATKKESFWCPECTKGQLVVIALLPNQQISLIEVLDHKSIIKEDSPAFTKEGELTEEISLEKLAELELDENFFSL
jgi:hypothetical protein